MPDKIYVSYNPDNKAAEEAITRLKSHFGEDRIISSPSFAKEPSAEEINPLLDNIDNHITETALIMTLLDNSGINNECFRYETLQGFLVGIPVIPVNITENNDEITNNPFTDIGVYFDNNGKDCFPMELIDNEWEQYELISHIDLGDPIHDDMKGKVYSLDIFFETQKWNKNQDSVLKLVTDSIAENAI